MRTSAPRRLARLALVKRCLAVGAFALSACTYPKEKPAGARMTCAPETVELMKKLGVEPGHQGTLVLDAQQPGGANDYGTYHPGPITSRLESALGDLPAGTLVEGVLWMDPEKKVRAHYTQARTPDGQSHPVCLVLGSSAPGGMYAEAGTTPQVLTLPKSAPFIVVTQFE